MEILIVVDFQQFLGSSGASGGFRGYKLLELKIEVTLIWFFRWKYIWQNVVKVFKIICNINQKLTDGVGIDTNLAISVIKPKSIFFDSHDILFQAFNAPIIIILKSLPDFRNIHRNLNAVQIFLPHLQIDRL